MADIPRGADPSHRWYKKDPGPWSVETLSVDWMDAQRQRPVPAKIYYPAGAERSLPVIIFSHGTGGSRAAYAYLGQHWASHGYVSVHVQHLGSDTAVWQGQAEPMKSMRAAATSVENSVQRPRDVSFAIRALDEMARGDSVLSGRLDRERIGAAGHSFGAYTTLAVAGQVFVGPDGEEFHLAEPRVKAGVAMSPSAPRRRDRLEAIYGSIHIPLLHMTGTRDESPLGLTAAADRRLAFDHIRGADQCLVIFRDADHMVFSDHRRRLAAGAKDPQFHELIRMTTTAFWDAYLKEDSAARAALAAGLIAAIVADEGRVECKPV